MINSEHSFTTGNSVTGIVRHIGIADNFRRLLKSIDNFSALFGQVWTLFVQSCRCPYKVDVVRTKLTFSYKVDVVRTKLSLFVQS